MFATPGLMYPLNIGSLFLIHLRGALGLFTVLQNSLAQDYHLTGDHPKSMTTLTLLTNVYQDYCLTDDRFTQRA